MGEEKQQHQRIFFTHCATLTEIFYASASKARSRLNNRYFLVYQIILLPHHYLQLVRKSWGNCCAQVVSMSSSFLKLYNGLIEQMSFSSFAGLRSFYPFTSARNTPMGIVFHKKCSRTPRKVATFGRAPSCACLEVVLF